jgi:hypothetical protein
VLKNREIRLSVKDRLTAMLQAPDAATGLSAFNVYTEAQYRQAAAGAFIPTFPFVYVLDAFMAPVPNYLHKQQPFIVVEIDFYESRPFELGNRQGRHVEPIIHVFGTNRGERDDLGSFIADYFGRSLSIKTYPSGVEVEDALIEDTIIVRDIFTARMEKVENNELAGSLLGWTSVSFGINCKL